MIIPVPVEYTSSLLKLNSKNKITAKVPEEGFFHPGGRDVVSYLENLLDGYSIQFYLKCHYVLHQKLF